MFDRVWIKKIARDRFRLDRRNAILVMLVLTLLGGVSGGSLDIDLSGFTESEGASVDMSAFADLLAPILASSVVLFLLGLAITIFFTNVLATGGRGWYLRYVRGETPDVGEAFASFRIYKPVVGTALLRNVYVFLWSLLFVIPGIVKSYAYSMADYIIYENPNLTADEALSMSVKMTNGAKGDLFVFDLSFVGWNLLNAFTFGILGVVYVHPYMYTAHAAVYDALKWKAIADGVLTWENFGQLPPAENTDEPPMV